ncbi:MAG: diguanylate cyclase [Azospira sp.]|jgi:diguanylate cyclase (GGDEF)-like protein/PAS domain S-box-containing protein
MKTDAPIRPQVSLRPIRRGVEALPLLLALLLSALLWAAVDIILAHEKERELEHGYRQLDYLRRTFQEHSHNTLTTADQILRLLKAEFEERPGTREFSEFRRALEHSSIFVQLGVIGADGELQWSNVPFKQVNLKDREHFQVHVDRDSGQVFISKPVLGRASGKWSIQLSRRLNHQDGSFAGVAVASVDPQYLARFYQEVGLQAGTVLGLIGHDRVLRVRVTDKETAIGQTLSDGAPLLRALHQGSDGRFRAPSSFDGTMRLYSYGQMPGLALSVVAGFDEAQVLAPYQERARSYRRITAASTAALLLTGLLLWWLLARLRQARQEVEAAHAVFSASPDPMVMLQRDPGGHFHYRYFNPAALTLAGRRAEEMQHHPLDQVLTPEDALRRQLMLDETVRSGEVQEAEQTMSYPGGERTVRWTAVPVHDGSEHISHVALVGHDLTLLREEQRQLWLSDAIVAQTHEAVMVTDASERIFRVNPAFCLMTGYAPEEVEDHSPGLLASGVHDAEFYHHMHQALQSRGFWQGDVWQRHKDGHLFACLLDISTLRDGEGRLTHYVHVFSDITAQKHLAEQMEHLAHFDGLTQLPNRNLFQDRLCQALARAERNGTGLALMFMDLDGFKAVNDSAGHNTGDRLLVEVARRITSVLRKVDSVSRQGGDEFTVLLESLNNGQGIAETEEAARRIIAAINEPVLLDGRSFRVGASIGIAFYPADGDNVELLMARADAAMYQAKARGKNRHLCWTPELAPGEA